MSKVKLGTVIDSCLGKMLDAAKNKGEYEPYLANLNVRWGDFDLDNLSQMRFESHEQERYGIKYGDLIMCEGGEPGRCAIWRDELPDMKIQKALHRIRPHDCLDVRYLYYWFLLAGKNGWLNRYFTETTIKHLPGDSLKDVEIDLIDLPLQKGIADVLSSLDDKIRHNNRICRELEAMAKTLYDYWFAQFDFPDENGKPYRTSGGEMVWNEQLKREIPKGWTVGKIGQLGSIVSGGTPTTTCADYYCDNGFAWITPNDLSGNGEKMFVSHGERDVTQAGIDSSSAVLMPKHSVLLSTRAPIGYLAISDNEVCTNQGFKSIIPDAGYHEYYIYYLLKRNIPAISRQGVGTTFKEVSKETLSDFKLPLPPKPIANEFANAVSSLCENRCILEKENQELTKLRDWLLPMLMNGQARVE